MTSFTIKFPDYGISKTINDIKGWKNIEDLKKKIGEFLHLDSNRFNIENEKELNSGSHVLNLKICNKIKDTIHLRVPPKNQKINLNYGASMKFDDVFSQLKQNNYFYSPSFDKNNFIIKFTGIENTIKYEPDCYPFLNYTKGSKVILDYAGKYAYIKCGQKIFFFPDNEKAKNACQFILSVLQTEVKICSIKIQDKNTKQGLNDDDELKKDRKYSLKIECIFNLRSKLNEKANSDQKFEYISTILEAQKLLLIFYSDFNQLKENNIIIFDQEGQKVNDTNTLLKDVQNKENIIYFDIEGVEKIPDSIDQTSTQKVSSTPPARRLKKNKFMPRIKSIGSTRHLHAPIQDDSSQKVPDESTIPIQFIFENSDNLPFKMDVKLNTKMAELSQIIAEKCGIEGQNGSKKIQIQYQFGSRKFIIDREMTVDDVRDEIKTVDETGDERNQMFIFIKEKNEKKSKRPIKKKDFIPHKRPVQSTSSSEKFDLSDQINSEFTFEFENSEKKINLQTDSSLKENEDKIKEEFGIGSDDEIEFQMIDKSDNLNEDDLMENFKDCKIKIIQKVEEKNENENDQGDDQKVNKNKYSFQTNKSDKIFKISLEIGSTVKDFKKEIAAIYSVENLANIKVIFSGKDLLDDIVLDKLNVGDLVLYVYIRSTEDILLMTAKALRISKEKFELDDDDDDIIEEEEVGE